MFKERDEQVLSETVALLEHEQKLDSLSVVLKMMVERTLALLHKSTDFLDDINVSIPSADFFQTFHQLDQEIRRSIESKQIRKANELLVDYIDILPSLVSGGNPEQIRKLMWADIMFKSDQFANMYEQEQMEIYTSSEVAELLGVTDQTIRRWCEKGKYPEAYRTDGGHWRIPKKYFKISLEEAQKRKIFEQKLSDFNASNGEVDESEWM
ncbi:helix-turn-helix domain-containing protein [Paenibacillus sp. HB172176]|uniref:MerR family transcriptional regulator n=1 Tax=Paenibacillus sp. HB172176 TaxID=2493690 RepID=UPI00143C52C5|nr:helix-turn-helix domain-containing protein [Paenibacillus sp. HB172176]